MCLFFNEIPCIALTTIRVFINLKINTFFGKAIFYQILCQCQRENRNLIIYLNFITHALLHVFARSVDWRYTVAFK